MVIDGGIGTLFGKIFEGIVAAVKKCANIPDFAARRVLQSGCYRGDHPCYNFGYGCQPRKTEEITASHQ